MTLGSDEYNFVSPEQRDQERERDVIKIGSSSTPAIGYFESLLSSSSNRNPALVRVFHDISSLSLSLYGGCEKEAHNWLSNN